MPFYLTCLTNNSSEQKDMEKLLLAHPRKAAGKKFRICYVTGLSFACLALKADIAENIVIRDKLFQEIKPETFAYDASALLLRIIRDTPKDLIARYQHLQQRFRLLFTEEDKKKFLEDLQKDLNIAWCGNAQPENTVSLIAIYIFLVLQDNDTVITKIREIHNLLKENHHRIIYTSQQTDDYFHSLGDKDLALLQPYPDHNFSQNNSSFISTLWKNNLDHLKKSHVSFLFFCGVLGRKNQPHFVMREYALYLAENPSYEPDYAQTEYIENFYFSEDFAEMIESGNEMFERIMPCFHRIFEAQASQNPDETALIWQNNSLTYKALNEQANRLAHYLLINGLAVSLLDKKMKKEACIVAIYLSGMPLIISILAVMKTGAAFVLIDANKNRFGIGASQERIVQSNAAYIITTPELSAALKEEDAQKMEKISWEDINLLCISPEDIDCRVATSLLKEEGYSRNLNRAITSHDLAYVMFTSGSTGNPKGVKVTQRLAFPLAAIQQLFNIAPQKALAQVASPSFDAILQEIINALGAGGTLVMANDELASGIDDFTRVLQKNCVTAATLTPALARQLNPENFPYLRALILTGECVEETLIRKWQANGRVVINGWGMNETTICGSLWAYQEEKDIPVNIGTSILGLKFHVRAITETLEDREKNICSINEHTRWLDTSSGEEGVLYISGAILFSGYLGRPNLDELSLKTVYIEGKPHTFYCTNDVAYYLPDGRLVLKGRIDRTVKLQGQRVDLEEIESKIKAERDIVKDARVVCHKKETAEGGLTQIIAVYIVPVHANYIINDSTNVQEESLQALKLLREKLSKTLPAYKLPFLVNMIFVEKLPIKSNDKKSYDDAAMIKQWPVPCIKIMSDKISLLEEISNLDVFLLNNIRQSVLDILKLTENTLDNQQDLIALGMDSLSVKQLVFRLTALTSSDENVTAALKKFSAADFYEAPTVLGIYKFLIKQAENAKLQTRQTQQISESLRRKSCESLMFEETAIFENQVYGNSPIPIFSIHSITGDAELDYRQSFLHALPFEIHYISTQPIKTLLELRYIKTILKDYVDKILEASISQPVIFLAAWSSGYVIAKSIVKLLRQRGKTVSLVLFDSIHPNILQTFSIQQSAVELLSLAEAVIKFMKIMLVFPENYNFPLPDSEILQKAIDNKEQAIYFFDFLISNFLNIRISLKNAGNTDEAIKRAFKMLVNTRIFYMMEIYCKKENLFLDKDELLIASEDSVKKCNDANLGWHKKTDSLSIIVENTDHFSLLSSKKTSEIFVKFIIEQINKTEIPCYQGVAELMFNHNPTRAIEFFELAERNGKTDYLLFLYRGKAYFDLENYNQALINFQCARKLKPDTENAYVYVWIARVMHRTENYTYALKYFNYALSVSPVFGREMAPEYFDVLCKIYAYPNVTVIPLDKTDYVNKFLCAQLLVMLYTYAEKSLENFDKKIILLAKLLREKLHDRKSFIYYLEEALVLDPENKKALLYRNKEQKALENRENDKAMQPGETQKIYTEGNLRFMQFGKSPLPQPGSDNEKPIYRPINDTNSFGCSITGAF